MKLLNYNGSIADYLCYFTHLLDLKHLSLDKEQKNTFLLQEDRCNCKLSAPFFYGPPPYVVNCLAEHYVSQIL